MTRPFGGLVYKVYVGIFISISYYSDHRRCPWLYLDCGGVDLDRQNPVLCLFGALRDLAHHPRIRSSHTRRSALTYVRYAHKVFSFYKRKTQTREGNSFGIAADQLSVESILQMECKTRFT
jgi:hypothetical protein